jgi:hypothetical protein
MTYTITYKDGKEEELLGFDEFEFNDGFVEFSNSEIKKEIYISNDVIAKIE